MKTIAITGGTGFVGRHVIAAVRDAGHSVRALARRPQENEKGLVWVPGALEDQKALDRLVSGADAVIHLAGLIKALTPHQFFAANRDGTGRLLAAIQNHAPYARFVYVSSLAAREPQLSPYAASKFAAEQVVAEAARVQLHDWAIVRPPGIYGPGDQEILKLIKAAKRGFLPAPGAVKNKVSLLFGPDLATLLRDLALMDGSVHGLCMGLFWKWMMAVGGDIPISIWRVSCRAGLSGLCGLCLCLCRFYLRWAIWDLPWQRLRAARLC